MAQDDTRQSGKAESPRQRQELRRERLAAALRTNLLKRKAQVRSKQASSDDDKTG